MWRWQLRLLKTALTYLAVLAWICQHSNAGLAGPVCEKGGFCSCQRGAGGYVGYVDAAEDFKNALKATAYTNEVIITSDDRVDSMAQFLHRFQAAGYCHVLLHMASVPQCTELQHVVDVALGLRNITCGLYAHESAGRDGNPAGTTLGILKHRAYECDACFWKWYSTARAVMLGYNVLAVDSDVVPLADWYLRVKQPPASRYAALVQAENDFAICSGWAYFQNAAPGGPTVWFLYEVLHRTGRFMEDSRPVMNLTKGVWAKPEGFSLMDQAMMSDVLASAVVGRPMFPGVVGLQNNPEWRENGFRGYLSVMDYWYFRKWKDVEYTIGGELAELVFDNVRGGNRLVPEAYVNDVGNVGERSDDEGSGAASAGKTQGIGVISIVGSGGGSGSGSGSGRGDVGSSSSNSASGNVGSTDGLGSGQGSGLAAGATSSGIRSWGKLVGSAFGGAFTARRRRRHSDRRLWQQQQRVLQRDGQEALKGEGPAGKKQRRQRRQRRRNQQQRKQLQVKVALHSVNMTIPRAVGFQVPSAFGGMSALGEVGPYTRRLRQAFAELGAPLPPDPENPADEPRILAMQPELFGLLPVPHKTNGERHNGLWLMSNFWTTGLTGLWHSHLSPPYTPAMGHLHWIPLWWTDRKNTQLKLTGHYHWGIAEVLYGPGHVYLASRMGTVLDRVVAYRPGVIHSGLSEAQYLKAVHNLAKISLALGAVAAWPPLPCDAKWVHVKASAGSKPGLLNTAKAGQPGSETFLEGDFGGVFGGVFGGQGRKAMAYPWTHLNTRFKVFPFGGNLHRMQCEWAAFGETYCLGPAHKESLHSRGMLAVEFSHLLGEDRDWAVYGNSGSGSDDNGNGSGGGNINVGGDGSGKGDNRGLINDNGGNGGRSNGGSGGPGNGGGGSGGSAGSGSGNGNGGSARGGNGNGNGASSFTMLCGTHRPVDPVFMGGPPPAFGNTNFTTCHYESITDHNARMLLQVRPLTAAATPVIVWLDRLWDVVGMDEEGQKRYEEWRSRCPALAFPNVHPDALSKY